MRNVEKILLFKRLKKSRRKRLEKNDSLFDGTSIGDLAFLLLIYFIVTASFILRQGIFLSLPAKSAGSIKVEENRLVHIYPTALGFQWENKSMERGKLLEVLKQKRKAQADLIAIIYMRPELKYDRLVDSLSLVKESGIQKVSLNQNEN